MDRNIDILIISYLKNFPNLQSIKQKYQSSEFFLPDYIPKDWGEIETKVQSMKKRLLIPILQHLMLHLEMTLQHLFFLWSMNTTFVMTLDEAKTSHDFLEALLLTHLKFENEYLPPFIREFSNFTIINDTSWEMVIWYLISKSILSLLSIFWNHV